MKFLPLINVKMPIIVGILTCMSGKNNSLGLTEPKKSRISCYFYTYEHLKLPGRVAQSVGHLTRKSGVLGSIPGLATYFRFSFRFFKKGSCQLLAKVCARSTG